MRLARLSSHIMLQSTRTDSVNSFSSLSDRNRIVILGLSCQYACFEAKMKEVPRRSKVVPILGWEVSFGDIIYSCVKVSYDPSRTLFRG